MFIPLNVNEKENANTPRVLVSGDTAMAFYLLGQIASLNVTIFIADTGIAGTGPAGFRAGNGRRGPDRASVYYDFFDSPSGIGAGIVRRMDAVLLSSGESPLVRWARAFRVPLAVIGRESSGTSVIIEGAPVRLNSETGCPKLFDVLKSFIEASSAGYSPVSSKAFIDDSGEASFTSGNYSKPDCMIVPEESPYSAWDKTGDVLKPGETLTLDGRMITAFAGDQGVRLIELGVPELHVLRISGKEKERYMELTGDATRVFDGIL